MPDTQQRDIDDAVQQMDSAAEDMERRSQSVGEQIEGAKATWQKADSDSSMPSAAGDWEDSEPDDSTGEDPAGFDDPEAADEDEDEDEDTAEAD